MESIAEEDTVKVIECGFEALLVSGEWYELRILLGRSRARASGYFDDRTKMAKDAFCWSQRGFNVYHTVNPALPVCANRARNHMRQWPESTTSDAEILRRVWAFTDIDSVHPKGMAANQEEHHASWERALEARCWLSATMGWPAPLVMSSGNGCYLLHRVDEDNSDASKLLFERVLKSLIKQFPDDGRTKIDPLTFNASRLMRTPGTLNMRGDDTEERPHRRCEIIEDFSEAK